MQLRTDRKYTREQLACLADMSEQFLYEIEMNKKGFSADTLMKLSHALEVSMDYIMLGKESSKLVLCQDLVQVKMSFSHSNLPAIPKLPVDTILQNHRVTYNRNDYEFVWYYKTFPSIQIPGGMHVCNC